MGQSLIYRYGSWVLLRSYHPCPFSFRELASRWLGRMRRMRLIWTDLVSCLILLLAQPPLHLASQACPCYLSRRVCVDVTKTRRDKHGRAPRVSSCRRMDVVLRHPGTGPPALPLLAQSLHVAR